MQYSEGARGSEGAVGRPPLQGQAPCAGPGSWPEVPAQPGRGLLEAGALMGSWSVDRTVVGGVSQMNGHKYTPKAPSAPGFL